MLFTDIVTIYQKQSNETWLRTVVNGVQWSDHEDKTNNNGRISVAKYVSITFPKGTYEGIVLDPRNEEDVIVKGAVDDVINTEKGHRVSDLMKKYKDSGLIASVNDNSNRDYLQNIKVVLS